MEKNHIEHLEMQLKELHTSLTRLSGEEPVTGLAHIIRKPGWTTPAEIAFFTGIVDAMHGQAKILLAMKQALLSGAAKVELNPQPLPPKLSPQPLPPRE